MDQPRGRGRARGRARGTASGSGGPPTPGPRPGPQQHQQQQQQQQAWGPRQQQQPAPAVQPPAQWGPRSQVQQQQQIRAPAPPPQNVQLGRASHRVEAAAAAAPGERSHSMQVAAGGDTLATHGRGGAMRGRRQHQEILITRPANVVKQGTVGTRITLQANYFEVMRTPNWSLFQYRVDFAPEEDRIGQKKFLLGRAVREILPGYLFDGTVLYTSNRLQPDPVELFVENDNGDKYRITIRLVGEVTKEDSMRIQIFNILLRKCLSRLKLQLVGRDYYDAAARITIPDHKLELWPGYVTSIRQHEDKIMLCAEISNKVMRMDTVYDLLVECSAEDNANYKRIFQSRIIGAVVLTGYNNRTYHIDDVDWSTTPLSTFQRGDVQTTFVDYFKSKYNINIRDTRQPLLISRAKPREIRMGMSETISLIPELCRMTGLTDAQRQNFQLMRALAEHTRVAPSARIQKLIKFCKRLTSQPEAVKELRQWDLQLAETLVNFPGRILPPENIFGGKGFSYKSGSEADWTKELRNAPMAVPVSLKNGWVIITPSHKFQAAESFMQNLFKASKGMQWSLPRPKIEKIPDDRAGTYLGTLDRVINSYNPSLIMCVVLNNKADRYSAIKKKCSIEKGIPSQVILARNLESKGVMSIATKVAIQMNCKLGGAPWALNIPLAGLMVVGYDVCHDTSDKAKSFGATVISLDKNLTRYFNVCSAHKNGEELSNDFALAILQGLKAYQELNRKLPDVILIYRDGVGDGQLKYVYEHELKLIREKLAQYYTNGSLKMAFIVVSKRIHTRLFTGNGENPPPGTIADDCVTLPERHDFYLVSQCVRQGTVSPTSYNIIGKNSSGLKVDHIQILTYKLTHLYYNWSGTVRVPAPCQYAHKLAFLAGQSLHKEPHRNLDTLLHYL